VLRVSADDIQDPIYAHGAERIRVDGIDAIVVHVPNGPTLGIERFDSVRGRSATVKPATAYRTPLTTPAANVSRAVGIDA